MKQAKQGKPKYAAEEEDASEDAADAAVSEEKEIAVDAASIRPALAARYAGLPDSGCFLCRLIAQDLDRNGKLTDHANAHSPFPAGAKLAHLRLERIVKEA